MCSYSRCGFFKWFGPSLVLEAEEATDMLPPAWATGEENRARSLGWTPGPEALPKKYHCATVFVVWVTKMAWRGEGISNRWCLLVHLRPQLGRRQLQFTLLLRHLHHQAMGRSFLETLSCCTIVCLLCEQR